MSEENIIVEISCPALSRIYDFVLYQELQVEETIQMIIKEIILYEGNNEIFFSDENPELFFEGYALSGTSYIYQYGIKNGSRLVLI